MCVRGAFGEKIVTSRVSDRWLAAYWDREHWRKKTGEDFLLQVRGWGMYHQNGFLLATVGILQTEAQQLVDCGVGLSHEQILRILSPCNLLLKLCTWVCDWHLTLGISRTERLIFSLHLLLPRCPSSQEMITLSFQLLSLYPTHAINQWILWFLLLHLSRI